MLSNFERCELKKMRIAELRQSIEDLRETCNQEDIPQEYGERLSAYERELEQRMADYACRER